MNPDTAVIIVLGVLILFFAGDPDIADAVMVALNSVCK